jgi:Family of unknown function (DUF5681)
MRGGKRSTSFKSGVSGNPGGRPKKPQTIEARKMVVEVKTAARELTQEAIDTLASVMKDLKAPPAARISAAVALLDRGHGRPAQAVNVSGAIASFDFTRLSDEELEEYKRLLELVLISDQDDRRGQEMRRLG